MDELLQALKTLIDKAEEENRPLTDEEVAEAESLRSQIEAHKVTAEYRNLSNAYNTPVTKNVAFIAPKDDDVSEELRAFHEYVVTGQPNAEMRALTKAGDGTAGGYLVPPSTEAKIIERLKAFGGLMNEATNITTASGERISFINEDDTDNTSEIVAEGAAAASAGADKAFDTFNLDVYKYESTGAGNLPMKVSWELIEDSPVNLENFIADNFARRIARKFSVDICVGDGSGEPLGIVTPQTAFDSITSNSAGPTYAELVSVVAELDPEYSNNAKWLMHPSTWWFLVANLLDGAERPLLQANANSGAGTAIAKQLLGHEVVLDPGMPEIGDTTKPIVFGDLKQSYIVRKVGGFHLQVFRELYAVNGFTAFMGWQRLGGTVRDLNSYVVLGAENTA